MKNWAAVGSAFIFVGAIGAANAQMPTAQPPLATSASIDNEYLLGPLDKISVKVFGEEKLSIEKTQIDAGGQIVLPLIGAVRAGGKTPAELSREVAAKLAEKYLVSPHVSVVIDEAVSQKVTVSGAVVESGVYQMKGRTTLMQAIAMAKGPDTKVANLSHVAVFRNLDGRKSRAVFNLKDIRAGIAEDPLLFGGDSIVVEGSQTKTFWRELIGALPGIGVFSYF